MVQKKTRVISAMLTVCMLISMLAGFAMPVTAEEVDTAEQTGELISSIGLTDTRDIASIQDYSDGAGTYKVSSREDLEKLSEVVKAGGFTGTILQGADIDMGWKNFSGIRGDFKGTFDGNGFVIKNLVVISLRNGGAGLFRDSTGAKFYNIGIASGLIMGKYAGSIASHEYVSSTDGGCSNYNVQAYNCWSAATVIGTGDSGGLFAKTNGNGVNIENCYFLGLLIEGGYGGGGLSGNMNGTVAENGDPIVKNSYVYGTVINGKSHQQTVKVDDVTTYLDYWQGREFVFVRATGATKGELGRNNYYRAQGNMSSIHHRKTVLGATGFTTDDGAVQKEQEDFAALSGSLNGEGLAQTSVPQGYTAKYSDGAGTGYPVITYYNGETPVIRRVAQTEYLGDQAVMLERNSIYAETVARFAAFTADEAFDPMGEVVVNNEADLWELMVVLALGAAGTDATAGIGALVANRTNFLGITSIKLAADLDMKKIPFAQVDGVCALDTFPGLASSYSLTASVDGQNHVIRGWSYSVQQVNGNEYPAFIGLVQNGTEVKNLGMEDGHILMNPGTVGDSYPAFIVSVNAPKFTNCYVTGKITVRENVRGNNNIGGLLGREWNNVTEVTDCWVSVEVDYDGTTVYAQPVGSSNINNGTMTVTNTWYLCEDPTVTSNTYTPETIGYGATNSAYLTYADKYIKPSEYPSPAAFAWALNQKYTEKYWKVNNTGTSATWANGAEDAVYRYAFVKYDPIDDVSVTEYGYANAGTKVALPIAENYVFDAEKSTVPADFDAETGSFTMPAGDTAQIVFEVQRVDYANAKAVYASLQKLNDVYFTDTLITAKTLLEDVISQETEETDGIMVLLSKYNDALAYAENLEMKVNTATITKENYKNLVPDFSEYDLYIEYNQSGAWGVSAKADWVALTQADSAVVASLDLYFKENINLGSTPVDPLCFGSAFSGNIYGMGHYIENLKIEKASVTGDYEGVALIAATTGTVNITELGIKSGTVEKTAHTATDAAGLGMFVAYSEGGSAHFDRCWTGPDTKLIRNVAVTAHAFSSGVFAARHSSVVKNCYSYTQGVNLNMMGIMGGWTYSAGKMENTFGLGYCDGSFDADVQHGVYGARCATGCPALGFAKNAYILGGDAFSNKSNFDGEKLGAQLKPEALGGELAYKMNQNRYAFSKNATDSKYQTDPSDWVYWTVDEAGNTVFGTEENQTRRLTLILTTENNKEYYFYGKAGEELNIWTLTGTHRGTFVAMEGNVGTINEGIFTFGDGDGVYQFTPKPGIYEEADEKRGDFLYQQGVLIKAYRVAIYNGNHYFISDGHRIAKNVTLYLSEKLVEGTVLDVGTYTFDENGLIVQKNGVENGYLYRNGCRMVGYKLVECQGDYYFVADCHKVTVDKTVYLSKQIVEGTPFNPGYYEFGSKGKMIIKEGVHDDYLYVNGVFQPAYRLVEYENDYYFVNDYHKIAQSTRLYMTAATLAGTGMDPGYYDFDVDGKMILKDGIVGEYFYRRGVRLKAYQLVQYGEDYYFIGDGNQITKNKRIYLSAAMLKGTGIEEGYYDFYSDGRLVLDDRLVEVPDLNALTQANAEAQVVQLGLAVQSVVNAYKLGVTQGLVVNQNPIAGDLMPLGSTLTLTISGAPQNVTVPDLTGMTTAKATETLAALELNVATTVLAYDLDQPAGEVLSQSVQGTLLQGSTVSINVGGQPQKVAVPDFNGMTPAEAEAAARAANFKVAYASGFDSTATDVAITSQSTAAGTKLLQGSTITLNGEVSHFGPLTVAAKNVQIFQANGTVDYDAYVRNLDEIGAEIVSCIRVDKNAKRTNKENQIQKMANAAGYPYYYFGKLMDLTSTDSTTGTVTDTGDYGLGIMSKWPMTSTTKLFTAQDEDYDVTNGESRGYIRSVVDLGARSVTVYTVWLSYASQECRMAQLAEVLTLASKDENAIVMGTLYTLTSDYKTLIPSNMTNLGTNKFISKTMSAYKDTTYKNGLRTGSISLQTNGYVYSHLLFSGDDQPETVTVPDFTGMTEAEAKAAAKTAGIEINIFEKPDSTQTAGQVYGQSLKAGAKAVKGKESMAVYYNRDYSDYMNVVTYNIKCARYGTTWSNVLENIASADADIVGIQEVDDGTTRTTQTGSYANQVQQLANDLGYKYWHFAKTIDIHGGEYGHGILSNYKIKSYKVTQFTDQDADGDGTNDEIRKMARYVLDVNGTELIYYNCHLNGGFMNQFQQLVTAMEKDYAAGKYVLLTGDFNIRYYNMEGYLNTDHFLPLNGNYNFKHGVGSSATYIDNIMISRNIVDYYKDDTTMIGVKVVDAEEVASDHPMLYSHIKLP